MTQTPEKTKQKTLTFFIIAGEESGDIHGSQLILAIKKKYSNCQFIGHGGNKMAEQGLKILEHINNLSMVGFSEVIKHLPYMKRVMSQTIKTIKEISPLRIILIDYPGFNLRLIKRISSLDIPITYFILPQVWAWKESRIKILRDFVDQSLSIFPFEQDWFKRRGVNVSFVGHPFTELNPPKISRDNFFSKHKLIPDKPLLILLPGSRQQEVDQHWKIFLTTVQLLRLSTPELQVVVGKAPSATLSPLPDHIYVEENTITALHYGNVALIASGTATLEAAVMNIPMVVCYRMSFFSWFLIKKLSKVSFASIVNLIGKKEIVPEFLQNEMTSENLYKALRLLLNDSEKRNSMYTGFSEVRKVLGKPGAYTRSAEAILKEHL
ncbi:MAG TPA: lipid-A-disaccharide synthase [Candidatus Marinimicrobia bacterium]|jgi:lipid-A-disaccharide synthase|nr:lipid-A-disaccharide synthase [Candidatus Neomarinimicrobiota bacterium]MDP7126450.1 lipid-A-disaccharide synthase [Candidatus Neomarinimicrobiota bacterium]MDP7526686.1 lipid-A-disaccharide synthase [Candidatus Neomarinimicrobiota bacterium]MEE1506627.1 lipid-A-disaccharide synthase [Candidatus Neomarinimicrobiota bacterium]MEE1573270.1 lipid-A-disaccharide synthase [Candidatus Neomarinimicrobiota bacterium]|tara:strand:+ start:356 stop:1495 length:1140 start_codon:yes stop_codon:yes gene_type:complete